jgi:hypothetical protein
MKNFFLSVVLTIVLAGVLQQFGPWWFIALAAFAVGYMIKQRAFAAFAAGFTAIFILWAGYAYTLSHANNDLLAKKVAELLPLKGNVLLLLVVTGVVGGLVSGFAALSGNLVRPAKR